MYNKTYILSFILLFFSIGGFSNSKALHIIEMETQVRVSTYPNPAKNYLMVEFDGQVNNPQFILSSMIGNKTSITPEKIGLNKYKINLEGKASGYYFLIIKNNSGFKKAIRFLKD